MPTPEEKRSAWVAWLADRHVQTAQYLTEAAERLRADAQRIISLGDENWRLRDAITTADLQIGAGHIEAARKTLHAAMDVE